MTYVASGWPVQNPCQRVAPRKGHSAKLAIKSEVEVLAGVPLFAGLSKRQLHDIARGCIEPSLARRLLCGT